MTDRVHSFLVVLEHDVRTDDAEATLAALRQIRGVLSVQPVLSDYASRMAEERARHELGQKLWRVLYPERDQ